MKKNFEIYSNLIEAAVAWSPEAVELTLASDKEYSAYIIKTNSGYKFTKPRRGAHDNVILSAVLGCPQNLFREVHFIHTHTDCRCHIPDKFSGDPAHPIKKFGDVSTVKILKYKSIFLVSPNGNIYRYSDDMKIKDSEELRALKPVAIIENITNKGNCE